MRPVTGIRRRRGTSGGGCFQKRSYGSSRSPRRTSRMSRKPRVASSPTAAPVVENRSLLGPAGEVGLVRVEVVLDALVDDRDVLVAVDRDLRRGCDPEAVDLIPDRLTLGLVERLPALRQQCVRLLDAGRAQVEPDPALEVVA